MFREISSLYRPGFDDAAGRSNGLVDQATPATACIAKKVTAFTLPAGCIAAYYPETNPLLPLSHCDPKSKTPAAKSIPVLVRAQPN